ncbi:MAG TPA: glycosyltransferase family 4 protein, partial [Longimicrobiales bacterium]
MTTVPATLRFVRGPIGYFKARGWTVHVLAAPGAALSEFGEREDVVVHSAALTRSLSPIRDLRALLQIVRVIRTVRPAVVHAHTPKAGLLGMLASIAHPATRRIYQVRGLPFESTAGFRRWLLRTCERITCKLAHRVFCDSASVQRVLLAEGLCRAQKCTTLLGGIGNGVDAQVRWDPARVRADEVSAIRERLRLAQDALVVGYIGRLAQDKGFTELASAWQQVRRHHPAAHLLVLGAPDARDPVPAPILARLRADESVHFAGRVADAVPYYAIMDVVVLPSYREGLPNVLLEAAAMGLPVVATRVTGNVDAVQHGVTGLLVKPHSAGPLAHALGVYLADGALRQRHGRAGRQRMLRQFRPGPLHKAYYAEYETLLRTRRPKRRVASGLLVRRGFDIAASSLLLILAAPLLLLIAAAVRLDVGPPILFRQTR